MKRQSYLSTFTLALALLALLAGSASATTYTNTASGNWSDSTKWTPSATVASAFDTIIQFLQW